jgi:hypothetical protein
MSTVFLIGCALGLRHAFDPDHLVAVTSMLGDGRRVRAALGVGLWWGAGHAATLVGVGSVILATGWSFPQAWQSAVEALVGVTIVLLGLAVLRNQLHGRAGPRRRRPLAVGAIHGIAGTGPLVILLALTFPTLAQRYAALLASALGTMCGMVLVSCCLALPFAASRSLDGRWYTRLQVGAGAAGVVYGVGFTFRALGRF